MISINSCTRGDSNIFSPINSATVMLKKKSVRHQSPPRNREQLANQQLATGYNWIQLAILCYPYSCSAPSNTCVVNSASNHGRLPCQGSCNPWFGSTYAHWINCMGSEGAAFLGTIFLPPIMERSVDFPAPLPPNQLFLWQRQGTKNRNLPPTTRTRHPCPKLQQTSISFLGSTAALVCRRSKNHCPELRFTERTVVDRSTTSIAWPISH